MTVSGGMRVPTPWQRFEAQPFDALIALMAMLAGVGFLFNPEPSNAVVARAYDAWPWLGFLFSGLLTAAGGLLIAGIATLRKDWRLAGLAFMAAAVVLQGSGIAIVTDDLGAASVSLALYAAVVGACVVRMRTLLAGRDVVVIASEQPPEGG